MPYSHLSELLNEFKPEELAVLTGDPSGGVIDENRINFAVRNADELIDNYLRERYNVPFPVAPTLVNYISRELAINNLYEYANHNGFIPPNIRNRRNFAIHLLKLIQTGVLELDIQDSNIQPRIQTNKFKEERLFNQNLLDTFVDL